MTYWLFPQNWTQFNQFTSQTSMEWTVKGIYFYSVTFPVASVTYFIWASEKDSACSEAIVCYTTLTGHKLTFCKNFPIIATVLLHYVPTFVLQKNIFQPSEGIYRKKNDFHVGNLFREYNVRKINAFYDISYDNSRRLYWNHAIKTF